MSSFEEFDTSNLKFIGAGSFGIAFLVSMKNKSKERVVLKLQFFNNPEEIHDKENTIYNETTTHRLITNKVAVENVAPSFTKLISSFRTGFPFETEFHHVIVKELDSLLQSSDCIYKSNIQTFLLTLSRRYTAYKAIVNKDEEAISKCGGGDTSRIFYTILVQVVVSQYGGENLFILFNRNIKRSYMQNGFSELDEDFILACMFQLFFSCYAAVHETGFFKKICLFKKKIAYKIHTRNRFSTSRSLVSKYIVWRIRRR